MCGITERLKALKGLLKTNGIPDALFLYPKHNEVILKRTSILKLSRVAHCPYTSECASFSFRLFYRSGLQTEPLPENPSTILILLTAWGLAAADL